MNACHMSAMRRRQDAPVANRIAATATLPTERSVLIVRTARLCGLWLSAERVIAASGAVPPHNREVRTGGRVGSVRHLTSSVLRVLVGVRDPVLRGTVIGRSRARFAQRVDILLAIGAHLRNSAAGPQFPAM